MERIYQPYLKLIEDCVAFARQFLYLPDQIEFFFDDCPSDRFPSVVNAAENDYRKNIWFNKRWLTGADRWNNHKDDIEFFVFHELRHMHQFNTVGLYLNGASVSETPDIILKWKANFENYTRNIGGESQDINLAQEVEIDANAYAALLANLYHLGDGLELHFSVPAEAMDIAMIRANQYQSKPEIQKYLQSVSRKQNTKKQVPVRVTKIGRNDPCPCGSGLKYKKCTCKEYHG